jgi:hypothetical protein
VGGAGAAGGAGGSAAEPPRCSSEPGCTVLQPGQVALGVNFSCALVGDGSAKCWGTNHYGELANGEVSGEASLAAAVVGLTDATMLAANGYHACALHADGTVSCWGLLNGSAVPLPVAELSDVAMIAAGRESACALRYDGSVWCWGPDEEGNAGAPEVIDGVADATFLAAGETHGCAVIADGSVRCWGSNGAGELGDGTTDDGESAVTVEGVTDAVSLALGQSFSCALTREFRLNCWGERAPRGNPEDLVVLAAQGPRACVGQPHTFPVCADYRVELPARGLAGIGADIDLTRLEGFAISPYHGCMVIGEGDSRSAWCWGSNRGRLGAGTGDEDFPIRVRDFP